MNVNYIKKLIKLVEESEIDQLEVKSWGRMVRITQRLSNTSSNGHLEASPVVHHVAPPEVVQAPQPPPAAAEKAAAETVTEEDLGRFVPIKAPMVGTFYAAPSPDSSSYVSLNEKITVGQVVCIVEAMKLMNEIEAEVGGRVAKVCVDNGQPVEFGQVLFLIDPD